MYGTLRDTYSTHDLRPLMKVLLVLFHLITFLVQTNMGSGGSAVL